MKTLAMIVLLASAAAACDNSAPASTTQTTAANAKAPDNTGVNARDKAGAVTPMDQGNGKADLDTTQAIRKAVMSDDTLSMNAKNVKIITENGVITLRGPVKSDAEKGIVEAKALAAAGTNRVDNKLDIQAN